MIANNPSRVYISRLTNKEVPLLLKVISKNFNKKIESLNISNSAAIVFHYINNLRKKINR